VTVLSGQNDTNGPDNGNGFRLNGAGVADFSGRLIIGNNVKGEIQSTVVGSFSPAGTGTIVLTAGDHQVGGNLSITTTGGYSEFNIRNNSTGNVVFGNNVEVVGTGITLLNPLGTAAATFTTALGNLKIGGGQELGVFLNTAPAHTVIFTS